MELSSDERNMGELDEGHLKLALRSLRECGYVLLEAALPSDWVDEMREAFEEEHRRTSRENPVRVALGHHGVTSPLRMPFLDSLAVAHPLALQIMEAAMGPDLFTYLPYGSNTSWPGSGIQHLHRDTGQLFPEVPYVLPISIAVVNIALSDFTLENGATEVWPGTHLITDESPEERHPAILEERARHMPSVRLTMPAGSIVIRDLRVWHRGMPNQTNDLRMMLAIVYFRQFHHLPDGLIRQTRLPRELWESYTDRERRLFRYSNSADE